MISLHKLIKNNLHIFHFDLFTGFTSKYICDIQKKTSCASKTSIKTNTVPTIKRLDSSLQYFFFFFNIISWSQRDNKISDDWKLHSTERNINNWRGVVLQIYWSFFSIAKRFFFFFSSWILFFFFSLWFNARKTLK